MSRSATSRSDPSAEPRRTITSTMLLSSASRSLTVLLAALGIQACVVSAAVPLVENGAARADVVLAADATADEKSAAAEFVRYVQKSTGVELPVRRQRGEGRGAVVIGRSAVAEPMHSRLAALGADGFVIDVSGNTIVLAGNGQDGTRSAVYEFLEQVAGVRWLWPGEVGEVVPRTSKLVASELSLTKEPAFVWRWLGPGGSLWGPHDKWTKERDLGISTAHQAAMKLWERRNRFGGERIF